ncbi:MAG: hypothetical protein Q9216_000901 [Gyalolechia sp. 2 TL-2023]
MLKNTKFMQRAATSIPPSTPQILDAPPSKRRKTSNNPSPITTPNADAQAYHAAIDAEEAKRNAAIERIAAEAGETKWVFSTAETERAQTADKKLQFLTAGYSDIDQDIQTTERQSWIGRRNFGRFGHEMKKQQGITVDSVSSSSANESPQGDTYSDDEGTHDSTDPTEASIRKDTLQRANAERKTMKPIRRAEAARLAKGRRSKEVKLNQLSSISGGGGGGSGIECHFCGQKGHKKANCPGKAKQKRREKIS